MSLWTTTSTTGLETALTAAIGSTLQQQQQQQQKQQQHQHTITNNLKGQSQILHIGKIGGTSTGASNQGASVASNLHHLNHNSSSSSNNININHLQNHLHHHNNNPHNYNIHQQSILGRASNIYSNHPIQKRTCAMSQSGDDLHSPSYLSWRKLQLSRAKLKASSKTSALLSGFAMVAMVEVQINNDTHVPPGMLVAFAICTTLLVAVHMLALMISTCILPNIEAVCNLHSISLVHESPHERLHWYIETAWAFSTLLGLILFLIEIAILCWVKFYDLSKEAAWSACIVLLPVLVVFLAFAIHFYRSLMTHKYEVTASGIRELEILKEQLERGEMEHDHLEHHRNNGMHFPGSEVV
ncbi:calcium release-activated calcium channel protein 1 isoform X3 [Contarinia nasturtii]|uniref:calcium release-activated calcium channel protein 1 isoform X3 n=1 Tax=Contarinia nasturtii TaxID=265458 RepID=UPI0012D499FA|nr:calcium release-activated calcium channel protein 1 isoform X3 [Contarinia nasturtii]